MLRKIMTTTAAAAIAVSSVSFATVTTLAFSAEMAAAGNGNGNNGNGNGNGGNGNNGNGNGGGNAGGNGNGAIASALGALNAAHASPNALANASPNSRVGLIAIYQEAAIATTELTAAEAEALALLEGLTAPTRTVEEIQAELDQAIIDGLDTTVLEAELADAEAHATAQEDYDAAVIATAEAAAAEAAALEDAANKAVPTGEALDALRVMLGLE